MPKEIRNLKDITTDELNTNKHTLRGDGMLESSIEECGWGDSMTVDKNGKMISGEARLGKAIEMDMVDPIIVVSDGTRPIVHVREDLDLDANPIADSRARRLSIQMNQVHRASYQVDPVNLAKNADMGIEIDDLFSQEEMDEALNEANKAAAEAEKSATQSMTDALEESKNMFSGDKEKMDAGLMTCTCPKCGEKFEQSSIFGGRKKGSNF